MKRAIIYARVSSKRQADDGLPLESQIEHCRAKAEALGAIVSKVFVDGGKTGRTDLRAAFQDALNYCAVMDVDYFITWSSSRFARNHLDAGKYKALLARYGTRLLYSSTELDIRTDDGWFVDAISAVIDERYSRQVSTDTRRSMLKAARDGFFLGGRVPFGYVSVPEGKRKRLAVHPTEGSVVKTIFGMSLRGCGTKLIAMQLNAQGMTMRGQPWSKNTVNYILKNEVYVGLIVFNRRSARVLNPEEDWIKVPSHPPIVTNEDFERVNAMLEKRQPANAGGATRSNFAFTGLLKCGRCGSSLQTCSGRGRSQVYYYYGCRASLTGKNRCELPRFRADHFEEWMLEQLLDQVMTPERIEGVIREAYAHRRDWVQERAERRGVIVKDLRSLERSRSKLFSILEEHGRETPNLPDLTTRLRELNANIKLLEKALTDLENETLAPPEVGAIDPAEASEALRGLVMDCNDPRKLREFVGSFVKEITVGDVEVLVDYHPECLVQLDNRTRIRSAENWLLNLGSNQGPTD
ncbi:recombinase family protein [Alicycliphilus sp. T452]